MTNRAESRGPGVLERACPCRALNGIGTATCNKAH